MGKISDSAIQLQCQVKFFFSHSISVSSELATCPLLYSFFTLLPSHTITLNKGGAPQLLTFLFIEGAFYIYDSIVTAAEGKRVNHQANLCLTLNKLGLTSILQPLSDFSRLL